MQTVFVSGNDTDVGKTHVLGQLAGTLAARGLRVQIVKLVETGMPADTSPGDADRALAAARKIARSLAKTASTVPLEPAAGKGGNRETVPLEPAALPGDKITVPLEPAALHGDEITVPLDKGERARKLCSAKRSGKGVPEKIPALSAGCRPAKSKARGNAPCFGTHKKDMPVRLSEFRLSHSACELEPAALHGDEITVPLDKGERARKLCSAKRSGKGVLSALISAFRLARFTEPLAPTEAARRDGAIFSVENLCEKMRALPPCDVRLIEGAGGLAVPVDDSGRDWADFARAVADATLLVVENRLGGICQARFLAAYCAAKRVPAPYFWLNEIRAQSEGVLASNAREIPKIGIPVLGTGTPRGTFSVVPAALDSLLRARESK